MIIKIKERHFGHATFSANIVLKGKGNIKEKSRVIQSWTSTSSTDFHNSEYRENILSITFLDTAKVPNNAVQSWDVSELQDKGVMAYVTINEEDNTKYDLFIGAKDGVIANKNSAYLFNNFINVTSINFNNNFDTSSTTSMLHMFSCCSKLSVIDVSTLKTKNVTSMAYMFAGFTPSGTAQNMILTEIIGIENFNTMEVKSMERMFYNTKLKSIYLSNFNTSNVTSMYGMFQSSSQLTELDLSSFNTNNVNLSAMFANCINLKTIYVSNNFITTNATNSTSMFTNTFKLVGENGTIYSSEHTDKEYARIDTPETPGYFTLKTE